MNKSASQILQEARALVEQGWCQGPYSEEIDGRRCYCAVGAVYQAAGGDPLYEEDPHGLVAASVARLDATTRKLTRRRFAGAACYNEEAGRTQAEVLALFDAALVEGTK